MKKILFDAQIFRKQKFGGISRYFTELVTGIAKQPGYEVSPKKFYSDNVYLAGHNLNSYPYLQNAKGFKGKSKIEKLILKAEDYKIAASLKKGDFEVFHPTYYDSNFLKHIPANRPFVLTVHDMIHESYYDKMLEYLTEETKHKMALIPRASHIIAVSQYTKNQILKYFPQISADNISVIYHGTSLNPKIGIKKPAGLPGNYLLFVGIKKHYKNFFWLAEALQEYLVQNNITLVCAGGPGFDTYENDFITGLNLNQHIKHFPVNSDDDIIAAYQNADCFIFPSLIEGFGIPILEAFSCGCPAVLVNSSCFPEIAGDAALYFEPGNNEDLIQKISSLNKGSIKKDMVKKGLERVKQFSWETTVARHLEIYESLKN